MEKPFLFLLALGLIFLIVPGMSQAFNLQGISRQDIKNNLTLPQEDTYNIIHSLNQELANKATNLTAQANREPQKEAVTVLVRKAVRQTMLRYLMIDAPIDVAVKITKEAVKIAIMFQGGYDFTDVIDKMEKFTVQRAVSYALGKLLQDEIRINAGALQVKYENYKGKPTEHTFQYVIVYQSSNKTGGQMGVKIFSPQPFVPPDSRGGYSSNYWDFQTWKQQGKEAIPPCTVTIQGRVEKTSMNYYEWQGMPEVKIEFPDKVPDLGFRPQGFWQRHLWEPLKQEVKTAKITLAKVVKSPLATKLGIGEGVKERITGAGGAIKGFFKSVAGGLQGLFSKPSKGARIVAPSGEAGPPSGEAGRGDEGKLRENLGQGLPAVRLPARQGQAGGIEKPSQVFAEGKNLGGQDRQGTENRPAGANLAGLEDWLQAMQEQASTLARRMGELGGVKEKDKGGLKDNKGKLEKSPDQDAAENQHQEAVKTNLCSLRNHGPARHGSVVFNEIAWMGTTASYNDEWIELKNIGPRTIGLNNWQILDQNGHIKIVIGDIKLKPGRFLLLERTDDASVPKVKADLIYTGSLSNTNEALFLFDGHCHLQDIVKASGAWPAGNNQTKQTMERTPYLAWQTSRYPEGTPKQANSPGATKPSSSHTTKPVPKPAPGPSPCSQQNLGPPALSPVVINEVAWMGTAQGWRYEWFELKNISAKQVSLNNWQVLDKNEQIKIFFDADDVIAGNGFLVLKRYEESLPHIKADKIYTGFLNNDHEALRLFDSKCRLIDQAEADPEWPAGDNEAKKTMERNSDLAGWHTFSGAPEHNIWGTPGQENSEASKVSESTTGETETIDTQAPIAAAGQDQIATVNQPIGLDGTGSNDNTGIALYQWDINSADGLDWENPDLIGPRASTEAGYSATGTYTITLRVADQAGNAATDSLKVIVKAPPRILISEVQPGTETSATNEFVELYNPNKKEINLTNWALKRKTKSGKESNLVSASAFSGIIGPGNYFLIAHQTGYQPGPSPDLYYSGKTYSLSPDNTVLLYDQYGNLIDKLGFGLAGDFEGKSPALNPVLGYTIGRKWLSETKVYQDTNNNFQDFELQIPTPGAQNQEDKTAPKVTIESMPPSLTNQTGAKFVFSANKENCSFECRLNQNAWQECASPWSLSELEDNNYTFQVRATDIVGNTSEPVAYSWTIDTSIESPVLTLSDPDSGSTVYTNERKVAVEVSNDQEAVAWFLSTASTTPASTNSEWLTEEPFSTVVASAEEQDGVKTVYVWTKDEAGNVSILGNSGSIILDTTPPELTLTEPTSPFNQTSTEFSLAATEDSTFQYRLDQGVWRQCEEIARSCSITVEVGEGKHSFKALATDQAGNQSATSSYTWQVDLSPPAAEVEVLSAITTSTEFQVAWQGTDNLSGIADYDIQFATSTALASSQQGNWQDWLQATTSQSALFTSAQDKTTYYFRGRARDKAGNVGEWPSRAQASTSIDLPNVPPKARFSFQAPNGLIADQPIEFNAGSSRDPDGTVVSYEWDFGDDSPSQVFAEGKNLGGQATTHSYAISSTYQVVLTITDNEGATSSTSTSLVIEPKPHLDLTITFPAQNQIFNAEQAFQYEEKPEKPGFQIITEGTTSPQALVSVLKNSAVLASTTATSQGRWELEITLEQGTNTFEFVARDTYGQTATTSLVLTLDTISPLAISDLKAKPTSIDTIQLSWTVPQTASQYSIRYSTSTLTADNWDSTPELQNPPQPVDASTTQSVTITDLRSNTKYWFGIKTQDQHHNISPISNIAATSTWNQEPMAGFSVFPKHNIQAQSLVWFNAGSSNDPDGSIVLYEWDFGDGTTTTTTQPIASHAFAASSTYSIRLIVTDNNGATSSPFSTSIEVVKPYPLISEVQIWTQTSSKHDFIELYNQTDQDIDISGWQLKKKSSTGKEYSVRRFPSGTVIPAHSYFLWANSSYAKSVLMPADTTTTQTLASNNSLALFDDTDIVDQVAWGSSTDPFVEASAFPDNPGKDPYHGLSLSRKYNPDTQTFQDTDNNAEDFEIATSSPVNSQGQRGDVFAPQTVQGLRIATTSNNQITLTWAAATDPDTPSSQISYVISYKKQSGAPHQGVLSTSPATTTGFIQDLYYDSTYTFTIQAFDGLYYSPVSSPVQYSIAPETPQWQMAQVNKQHNRRTPWTGAFKSSNFHHASPWRPGSGWGLSYSNQYIRNGPVIDQNGTVYIANWIHLSALEVQEDNVRAKWLYMLPKDENGNQEHPKGNLIIGQDGTIYMPSQSNSHTPPHRLIAVSPFGALKWSRTFSSDSSKLNINKRTLYLSQSYALTPTTTRPLILALDTDNGNIKWVFDCLLKQAFDSPQDIPGIISTSTSPSTVVIDNNDNIYFAYNGSVFSLNDNGQLLWEKRPSSRGILSSLAINDHYLYFLAKASRYYLYGLDLNRIATSSTTTILTSETKWPAIDIGRADWHQGPLLVSQDNHIYFSQKQRITGSIIIPYWLRRFFRINPDGTSYSNRTSYDFNVPFLDNNDLIYGQTPMSGYAGWIVLDQQGNKVLKDQHKLVRGYSMALSKQGALYAIGYYRKSSNESYSVELFWFNP